MRHEVTTSLTLPENIRASETREGDGIEFQGWPLIVRRHIQDGDYRGIYAVDECAEDEEGREVGMEIPADAYVSLYYRRGGGSLTDWTSKDDGGAA